MIKSTIITSIAIVFIAGCGQPATDQSADQDSAQATAPASPTDQSAMPPAGIDAQPAQSGTAALSTTGKVWHFTCPKGHAGGADEAASCAECGTPLEHNQAFHANEAPPQSATQPIMAQPGDGQATINQVQPPPPQEAPQNAKGVWHYTCPAGHPGGAGTQSTCASCGATLQHNQAYHE